jgi:hypothetical protein
MRPFRMRLTIRNLMIAVGLVGLILFGSITAMRMGSQATYYRSQASKWRIIETEQRKHLVLCQKEVDGLVRAASNLRTSLSNFPAFQAADLAREIAGRAVWWRANSAHTEEMIAYSAMMKGKYDRASHYPWLEIEPDPPQPYWSAVTGPPPDDPPDKLEDDPNKQAAAMVERLIKTVVD